MGERRPGGDRGRRGREMGGREEGEAGTALRHRAEPSSLPPQSRDHPYTLRGLGVSQA